MSDLDRSTILILAGRRDGTLDPLAEAAGVSHKCVVPVGGRPMIEWVLEAARASSTAAQVLVSIGDAALVRDLPPAAALLAEGRLRFVGAEANIVDSVLAAAAAAERMPLLITTADNVLLTPAAIREADRDARARGADAMIAFARKEAIQAAHPEGQRRFYRFRGGEYSNCNLFWIRDARALKVAETFREGGQFVKHPARIIKAFGILNLVRFRYGLATLDGFMASLSRRFRVKVIAHIFDDGRLAIDVDNERTHRVAEELLARA